MLKAGIKISKNGDMIVDVRIDIFANYDMNSLSQNEK